MLKKGLSILFIFISFQTCAFANFYIGPALFYEHLHADVDTDDTHLTYEGISPTLLAGYRYNMQQSFYIAGEVFVTANAIEIGSDESKEDRSLKTGVIYGASILPGMNLDNTLLAFVRLGYLRTKFPKLDSQEGAYQLGIGAEAELMSCWRVRLEYDYIAYRALNEVHIGKIKSNNILLSFIYNTESLME